MVAVKHSTLYSDWFHLLRGNWEEMNVLHMVFVLICSFHPMAGINPRQSEHHVLYNWNTNAVHFSKVTLQWGAKGVLTLQFGIYSLGYTDFHEKFKCSCVEQVHFGTLLRGNPHSLTRTHHTLHGPVSIQAYLKRFLK